METAARLQDLFFLHISQIPHKNFPKGRKFPFDQMPLERGVPTCSPKAGNRRPLPEPYIAYPSGSPVKEPSFKPPS